METCLERLGISIPKDLLVHDNPNKNRRKLLVNQLPENSEAAIASSSKQHSIETCDHNLEELKDENDEVCSFRKRCLKCNYYSCKICNEMFEDGNKAYDDSKSCNLKEPRRLPSSHLNGIQVINLFTVYESLVNCN